MYVHVGVSVGEGVLVYDGVSVDDVVGVNVGVDVDVVDLLLIKSFMLIIGSHPCMVVMVSAMASMKGVRTLTATAGLVGIPLIDRTVVNGDRM